MVLTVRGVLFLIAAIVFAFDFALGFALADTQYGPYRFRVYSFAFCLIAVAWTLWAAGR